MKNLFLILIAFAASCGPSKEKLEEMEDAKRHREIRAAIDSKDSLICSTFGLADTAKYK